MMGFRDFDVIVVGAGHSGCESVHISSKMGMRTILITLNLDTIAQMSCNPAIGGLAKGHLVREIDALGGIMGTLADETGIQFRLLNQSRGYAVQAPRAQCDKVKYRISMKNFLEKVENLKIYQGEVVDVLIHRKKAVGVRLREGIEITGNCVIISPGTFLNGLIHIGLNSYPAGRANEPPSIQLSRSLENLGFKLGRLKTGTPMRLNKRTINWDVFEPQEGDENPTPFSFRTEKKLRNEIKCYIGYTNKKVHEIIRKNLDKSPLYSGKIIGIGPRYCPSIEDKVVKFPHKERHQFFLEPEGLDTNEIYVNGISSSLPVEVQTEILKNIEGLENAEIVRPAYGIEYDFVNPQQIKHSLETIEIENLFFAGQINGTSGYEEAAAQGIMAGINTSLKIMKKEPFILRRDEAYMGVLLDDLIRRGVDEPYRLFTSRAEHRLMLRIDNADERLMKYSLKYGLIEKDVIEKFLERKKKLKKIIDMLKKEKIYLEEKKEKISLEQYLKNPSINFKCILKYIPDKNEIMNLKEEEIKYIEAEIKYSGYIEKEKKEIKKLLKEYSKKIPDGLNFDNVSGLSKEIVEKLKKFKPLTLGEASNIPGMTPAALKILAIYIHLIQQKANEANN
ncbi:MAG: tRNA uridine-5-carboxymethylaminomethyl(34) synthesis enzyme MnmG [Acidobacteriota bacterium]